MDTLYVNPPEVQNSAYSLTQHFPKVRRVTDPSIGQLQHNMPPTKRKRCLFSALINITLQHLITTSGAAQNMQLRQMMTVMYFERGQYRFAVFESKGVFPLSHARARGLWLPFSPPSVQSSVAANYEAARN